MDMDRIDAADALADALADLRGAADTLAVNGAAEEHDLEIMISRVVYNAVESLQRVESWLKDQA